MQIDLTAEQVALIVATAATGKAVAVADEAIVYPYRDPDPRAQGHLFATRAEHINWKAAVARRDAALDDVLAWQPVYFGKDNPDTFDLDDWRVWCNTPALWSREYEILDRRPWIGVRATGLLYSPGDMATMPDVEGYKSRGGALAKYL